MKRLTIFTVDLIALILLFVTIIAFFSMLGKDMQL